MDKKTTILDCVVKSLLDKNEGKVLEVAEDLAVVDGVTKLSSVEITRDMEGVGTSYKQLTTERDSQQAAQASGGGSQDDAKYLSRLTANIEQFSQHLENVSKFQGIMKNKIVEVIEYFGEDPASSIPKGATVPDISQIFCTIQVFRKILSDSKEVVERRERSEARNNGRARSQSRDRK